MNWERNVTLNVMGWTAKRKKEAQKRESRRRAKLGLMELLKWDWCYHFQRAGKGSEAALGGGQKKRHLYVPPEDKITLQSTKATPCVPRSKILKGKFSWLLQGHTLWQWALMTWASAARVQISTYPCRPILDSHPISVVLKNFSTLSKYNTHF